MLHPPSDRPVENVLWSEADHYCALLGGRLPTEEEWEYAARARMPGQRYGLIDVIAWFSLNAEGGAKSTRLKKPNSWKLYDMLGNLWEWTATSAPGGQHILRGGSYLSDATAIRVSYRKKNDSADRKIDHGFRCLLP